MARFPFWDKKTALAEEPSVVIDVGQDQVTAFWLAPNQDKKEIVDVEVKKIPRYPWTTKNRLRQLSQDIAADALSNLVNRQKIKKPGKIETLIAPGLESGLGYLIKYNEEKKFTVSPNLINQLVKAHDERVIKALGDGGTEPHLIKTRVLESRLNGYKLEQGGHNEGSDLAITSYTSVLPEKYLTALSNNLQIAAYHAPVVWSSRLSLDALTIKQDLGFSDDATLVDIAGYTSDILIYNQSGDIVTISFDFGLDTIIQNLANKRGASILDTQGLLNLYLTKSLHTRVNDQFAKDLTIELDTFTTYFHNSLFQALRFVKLPKNIIFISNQPIGDYFLTYLKKLNLNEKLLLPFPFQFSLLSTDDHLTKLLMTIYKVW